MIQLIYILGAQVKEPERRPYILLTNDCPEGEIVFASKGELLERRREYILEKMAEEIPLHSLFFLYTRVK